MLGIDLNKEIGFARSLSDNGMYFVSPCVIHIDAFHWVKRDSYLPAGSHGLKAHPTPTPWPYPYPYSNPSP